MTEAMKELIPVFQDYYKWKQKQLGYKTMHGYDMSAPLSSKEEKISYSKAQELVLNTFKDFDPAIESMASQFFEKNWIDARQAGDKYGGAYSWAMDMHPLPQGLHKVMFLMDDGFICMKRSMLEQWLQYRTAVTASAASHGVSRRRA